MALLDPGRDHVEREQLAADLAACRAELAETRGHVCIADEHCVLIPDWRAAQEARVARAETALAALQARLAALEELRDAAIDWRNARLADVQYQARRTHAIDSAEAHAERDRLRVQRTETHDRFWALCEALWQASAAPGGEG